MKHIVLTLARCQGITKGHQKVFELVNRLCIKHSAKGYVYFSKTIDKKKNPLTHDYRIDTCKKMMPHLKHLFINDINIRTIFDMVRKHSDDEVTLHVVCGGDRLVEYQYKFDKYNNTDYSYNKIIVHNAGDRNDGISGTYLRKLVLERNLDKFLEIIPSTADSVIGYDMYYNLMQILNPKESLNENTTNILIGENASH